MTRDLLWRGMLAGILAAVLATLFARAVAEPQIDLAIGVEQSHAAHHMDMPGAGKDAGQAQDEEIVSRDTQKGAGLLTALALYGAAVGGIFALVFAYGYGRVGGRFGAIGPRSLALLMAGLVFLLVVIVPAIKYPQTPPAVGKHETVALRTAAYFAMIALSLGAAVIAARLRSVFAARSGRGFDATLLAVGAYGVIVGLGQFLLPVVDEVPSDFPATLLWNFRIASITTQFLLWSTIGIAFGLWAERVLERQRG